MMGRGGKTRPMPDQASQESLKVLSFPHPYAGMLAINSDVEFTTWDTQMALMSLCGNLGLETAFSFWCFGDGKYTWRLFEEDNSLSPQAEMAFYLAREGFLSGIHPTYREYLVCGANDCVSVFSDFSPTFTDR